MTAPFTPTVTAYAAFGNSPTDGVLTWTALTGKHARDVAIGRGRPSELDGFPAGVCSFQLVDDTTRALDPANLSGTYTEIVTTEIYPVPGAVTTEVGTSLGSNNAQPAASTTVIAGDLLLAFVTIDDPGATGLSTGTGSAVWAELFDTADTTGPNTIRMACYARIATGSDALVLTGDTDDYVVATFKVVQHGCATTADIKVGTTAGSNVGTADPPNLNAGSTRKWLWIACAGFDETVGSTLGAAPTGMTLLNATEDGNDRVGQMLAYQQSEVSALNPTAFGSTTTGTWLANTLAIPPASSSETRSQIVPDVPVRLVATVASATLLNDAATSELNTAWRVEAGAITGSISSSYPLPPGTTMTGPAYNFDGDGSFQFGTATAGAGPNHDVRLVQANGGYIGFNLTATTITWAVNDGGSTTSGSTTWNGTTMRYLRIRVATNAIVFERSADASSWTTLATLTRGSDFASTVDWSYSHLLVRNNAAATTTCSLDDFVVKCSRFTLFTGIAESWDYQPLGGNQGAIVDVVATDAFARLANIDMRLPYVEAMDALNPTAWYRLADDYGVPTAHDSSGNNRHGSIPPPGTVVTGLPPINPRVGPASMRSFRTVNAGVRLPDAAKITTVPHSVNMWVQASGTFTELGLVGTALSQALALLTQYDGSSRNVQIYLSPQTSGGLTTQWDIVVIDYNSASTIIRSHKSTLDDGNPHMLTWVVSVSGTSALYIDGALMDPVTDFAGFVGIPIGNYIGKGDAIGGGTGGYGWIGLFQDVALFDGYHVNAADIANLLAAAREPWAGDSTGARIHRVLDLIGWPSQLRRIDVGTVTMGTANVAGVKVLEHLRACETAEGGRLFMGPHGEVVFHDAERVLTRQSSPTLFDDAGSGVNILADGFRETVDTAFIYTAAAPTYPGGQVPTYTDTTAADRYGTRTWGGQLEVRTGQEAYLRGVGVVERYKVPKARIGAWQLAPEKTPAQWATVLNARLGDTVRVQFQSLDTGDTYDQYLDLAELGHRIADGAWEMVMSATPQDPGIGSYLEWDTSSDLGWDYGQWR